MRLLAALVLLMLAPALAGAHRLDEYLQAARVAVAGDRVTIEMSLTPGVSLAETTIARLDRDGDGTIAPHEAERYGRSVVADLRVSLDAQPLTLSLRRVDVPPVGEFRDGVGTIRIAADGAVRVARSGSHVLRFENHHRRDESVYLVNALLPDDERITIQHQLRNSSQQTLDVYYDVAPAAHTGFAWLIVAAMVLVAQGCYRRPWTADRLRRASIPGRSAT